MVCKRIRSMVLCNTAGRPKMNILLLKFNLEYIFEMKLRVNSGNWKSRKTERKRFYCFICLRTLDAQPQMRVSWILLERCACPEGSAEGRGGNRTICREMVKGVEKDLEEAVRLYCTAAGRVTVKGASNLAYVFEMKLGVKETKKEHKITQIGSWCCTYLRAASTWVLLWAWNRSRAGSWRDRKVVSICGRKRRRKRLLFLVCWYYYGNDDPENEQEGVKLLNMSADAGNQGD